MTGLVDPVTGIEPVAEPDWSHIHEPVADDAVEGPLQAANQRGREAAVALLSSLLPGLPLADLSQTTDAATFHVSQATGQLRDLFDATEMLDDLFRWRSLHGQQLMFVREGEYLPQDALLAPLGPAGRPRLRTAEVAALLDEGFTVVLNGIDLRDGISMRLTEAFERVFGCAVNINGYLSMRAPMSFGAHWDDQETIILQLLGHKRWELEEPVALSMMKVVHGSATSQRPVWEGTLAPGAALYVPRGWGHRVSGVDELTYHYTVTVPRFNGVGVLGRILAGRQPRVGGLVSIPVTAGSATFEGMAPTVEDDQMRSAVAGLRLQTVSRSTQRLTDVMAALAGSVEGRWVRCPFSGGWLVEGADGDHLLIGAAGRQFRVHSSLVAELAAWADGLARPWPPPGTGSDTVGRLVRLGVLDVMAGEPGWGHPRAPES